MDHEARVERLRGSLGDLGVDALLVTNLTNVNYLTGFTGTNGQVLVDAQGATFLTDGRYRARAGALVRGAEVSIYPDKVFGVLAGLLEAKGVGRLGLEAGTVTLAERDLVAQSVPGVELVHLADAVERLRRRKEPAELEALRRSIALGDETFSWILERLAPGRTEREVALDIEMKMRSSGAEAVSFEPIVASGELSAHIHHSPTDRALQAGDLVLMDFGCRIDGYCSDLTRTVSLGPASDDRKEAYAAVLAAQAAGIAAAVAGRACREVDGAARQVLVDAGHPETFEHGLGHSIGLDIHEDPRFGKVSPSTLEPGDVMTVEPGFYKDGWGGIRIEDIVHVTEQGAEVLGNAPKDKLIEL